MPNQDPEQIARDNIDKQLIACGWVIQDKDMLNLNAGIGVVVRYYLTQDGKETDYFKIHYIQLRIISIIKKNK
jgi:type I restriction enzyme R subunit